MALLLDWLISLEGYLVIRLLYSGCSEIVVFINIIVYMTPTPAHL